MRARRPPFRSGAFRSHVLMHSSTSLLEARDVSGFLRTASRRQQLTMKSALCTELQCEQNSKKICYAHQDHASRHHSLRGICEWS